MNLIPWRRKQRESQELPLDTTLARFRHDMDDLFDRFWRDPWSLTSGETLESRLGWGPRVNVSETEDDVKVEAELPGIDPKDVDIRLTGDVLTISGRTEQEQKDEKKNYHYHERRYGQFQRSIRLPNTVDPDKVDAAFKNGLLTVTVAKRTDVRPKRIQVKTD
ncbi:MAG: Hsp20/alpha crystallin family protein [Phycisphaerae bacterium]|nr:Hsp20/alpha crystallin family protein [Phycisphaerae bacterium]